MFLKKKCLIMLATITAALLLTACGGSTESKIIGSWKVVINGNVESYLEIGEERIINRSESNDSPISAEYILTETQDDNFMIEFINPENGSHEFMFEGYFDNKNKIIVVNAPGGAVENSELIRVDNIAEEKEKEEKELAKKEEKLAKQEERQQEEKELAKQVEKRMQEEKEIELAKLKEEEETKQRTIEENSLKKEYLQKSDTLENKIMEEAKKVAAHDMPGGFYGQYYNEWDDLLNEVWGVLKDTMPKNEFEKLKSGQIEWIAMKEQNFDEIPDESAWERARGMDYLAFETKDRTYYLIENYMQ